MKCFPSLRVITLVLLFCNTAAAQVSIGEYLGSALQDPEVLTFEDQITFLNTRPYRLSPLRELQLRTQNRELTPTQQEFGIRLSPANPFEMKSQNQYFKEYNTTLSYEKEFALKEALIVRYLTVIEYTYFSDLRKLTEESRPARSGRTCPMP